MEYDRRTDQDKLHSQTDQTVTLVFPFEPQSVVELACKPEAAVTASAYGCARTVHLSITSR